MLNMLSPSKEQSPQVASDSVLAQFFNFSASPLNKVPGFTNLTNFGLHSVASLPTVHAFQIIIDIIIA